MGQLERETQTRQYMKTLLLTTIGFGAWLCIAACSSDSTPPSSPAGTGGAGGTSNGGAAGTTANGGSSGGSGGLVVSCAFTVQGMQVCTGFAGLSADAITQEQAACADNQGVFAPAACAATNASGTCTFTSTGTGQFAGIPAGTVVTYVYYSLTADMIPGAQQSCTTSLGGTWTAS